MDDEGAEGEGGRRERVRVRGIRRDGGGGGREGTQGCPSFKHPGLNGTDSSDI